MARQTAINTADDMRWLREVHLPRLPAKYRSAIIVGNEDFPDRIEVYERRDPRVTDVPVVFKADEDGVFKETVKGTAGAKRSHAAKKAGLSADQRAEIDAALGAYGARLTDDDRIAKGDKVMSVQVEAKGGRLKMVGGGNVLATYPASRAGQGVSDFVEKFWFWRKDATASAHATKKTPPAQLQREIDEVLAGDPEMRCDRLVREVRELESLADDGRLGYRARGGRGSTSANELYHASLRALGLTKGALKRGDCTDAEVNLKRAYQYFHRAEGLAEPTEPMDKPARKLSHATRKSPVEAKFTASIRLSGAPAAMQTREFKHRVDAQTWLDQQREIADRRGWSNYRFELTEQHEVKRKGR
jgi:hypothetical protein